MMKPIYLLVALAIVVAAGAALWLERRDVDETQLTLYGNLDLRQVSLAFNSSERITEILVDEGEYVRQGDIVAKLDTSRLELQVAQAEAQVASQRAVVERLRNGSRPEEIEQARANLASSEADAVNARLQHERQVALRDQTLTSQQDVDSARASMDAAEARVTAVQKALELLIAGPRNEDILQAEAQLRASEAQLGLLRELTADGTLVAPINGVVRARLLEPGDMASPDRPVFSLAIMDPKWVRAYVTEAQLGHVREGMTAHVHVDSFPDKRFPARIGFISSVAEFTPKNIETEDLRTSLVYEVRVRVEDPSDQLRLGMPVTVRVPLTTQPPRDGVAPVTTGSPSASRVLEESEA